MKLEIKATDKTQFDQALKQAIEAKGATIPEEWAEEIPMEAYPIFKWKETVQDDGVGEMEIDRKLALAFKKVEPKSKDADGNFIVTETDEDGNPITYQMEQGYFVNLKSSENIELVSVEVLQVDSPQFKWA